jgi:bla regulator protein BlaR1
MMNADKLWQDMKENYLCRVEAVLMMTDKTSRQNILKDVEEHLDRRYAELTPEQRMREQFETIISDMGPAEDYAELLTSRTESHGAEYTPSRGVVFLNRLMVILFLAVLFSVVGWKITTGSVLDREERSLTFFENDPNLVGQWVSVDFVQYPDAFTPEHRQWPGNLYLKAMAFYDNGTTAGPWQWTKGDIYHPGDKSHAKYQFREIKGETYLFFAWMNGDVLFRGEKPHYYVLKKGDAAELLRTQFQQKLPPFENDPQLVGKWISVDFVQHPDAFVLGQKQWPGELFLKKMRFYDNGKTDGPWEWTKGDIYHPGDDSHAKYQVHQIDGEDYLFFEFINGDVLIRGEKPRYFVLKKEK